MAKDANDFAALEKHGSDQLNDLDWRLSVCLGKFTPQSPTSTSLILAAHGEVAGLLRVRIEKAIKTLPEKEQVKV
jgi:hypothetical protein